MAVTGHKSTSVRARKINAPTQNWSVLECFILMRMREGFVCESMLMSWHDRSQLGSNVLLVVNSPARRKPKKPRHMAAHSIWSLKSNERQDFMRRKMIGVIGSLVDG